MLLEEKSIISGDAGHNCYPDSGYIGIRGEEQCNANIWRCVEGKLKNLNYEVIDCTPWNTKFNSIEESLIYRAKVANESKSKLHISIHFNFGGGSGAEAWICNNDNNAKEIANALLLTLKSIGYKSRGVKIGNDYLLKCTTMPCIILKCGFLDSIYDMRIYDAEKISKAIVMGLVGKECNEVIKLKEYDKNIYENLNYKYAPNAIVEKHWLYIRDNEGNIIPESRIDINTKIQIIDSYNDLLKIIYPTVRGVRVGYIRNGNWIKYIKA